MSESPQEYGIDLPSVRALWKQARQTVIALCVTAMLLGIFVALLLTYPATKSGASLRKELIEQTQMTRTQERENELLQLRLEEVQRSTRLLQDDLLAIRKELLERERDVTFYRGLLSPEELERGFKLHTVSLFATDKADVYEYEVVVAHVDGRGKKLSGRLELALNPAEKVFAVELDIKGEKKYVDSQAIEFKDKIVHRLGFRFFQRVSGEIKLPENFEPDTITVKGRSNLTRNQGSNAFEQSFDWEALLATSA